MRHRPLASPNSPDAIARRRLLRLAGAAPLAALAGCSHPDRGAPVPTGRGASASVLGVPNERFRIASAADRQAMEREFNESITRHMRKIGAASLPRDKLPTLEAISISGGGENGAFGAGLLCGWSEQGTRPVFDLVTGVSTGALTAPFAYLGKDYDPQLRAVYTEISLKDVLITRSFLAAIYDDALADTAPLFATISRYVDEALLAAIARAYDDGRMLLIGSTDLDAQVPVIWNVGAIAKSGHPKALDTVRRILLASAAIPGAFPPVMIDVTVDGQPHQEMHVDGGAFAQAFLYPQSVTRGRRERIARGEPVLAVRAYVIRNGRLDAEWASVDRRTFGIAGRAIETMIAAGGYNDVLRIYNTSQMDEVDYNLAFIGRDFTGKLTEPFEQAYMRQLFDYGFAKARVGYDWAKAPPL